MDCYFAWQAWHLWHWAGSGGALGFRRGAGDAAAVGVAGVALCDIYLHFVWQAWHFVTWIVTLRGRRGTYGTGLALVARLVLGVAPGTPRLLAWQAWHFVTSTFTLCGRVLLRDMDCYFAWQAWHLWHWAGSGGALGFRRGAGDAAAVGVAGVALCDIYLLCVAGVALRDMDCYFAWQAWHLWHWAGSGGALVVFLW